jgi:hypothetical protein
MDLLSALLSNGSVNKPQQKDRFYAVRDVTVTTQRRSKQTHLCSNWSTCNNGKCVRSFLCSRRRGYITRHWWDARQFSVNLNEVTVLVPVFKSCRREFWRVLLWREDLCVIIGVWDSYSLCVESVARRRLVEIENPSAWATVVGKLCKSAITLVLLVLECN